MGFYYLLRNLDLEPGSEVVITGLHVPDFVNMINLAGFHPVVVDINLQSLNIDFEDLKRKITPRTSLILVSHLYGYATDMNQLLAITKKNNILLVEDCSQTWSTSFQGQSLGTFGKAAIYSLSRKKHISTLIGGIIISNDNELLEKIRKCSEKLPGLPRGELFIHAMISLIIKIVTSRPVFSFLCFPLLKLNWFKQKSTAFLQRKKRVELYTGLPTHYLRNFTWQQAKLGLLQLQSIEMILEKNGKYGRELRDKLSHCFEITVPTDQFSEDFCPWFFPVLAENPEKLRHELAEAGFDSGWTGLTPLNRISAFEQFSFQCDNAALIKEKTVLVPVYYTMKEKNIDQIVSAIRNYCLKN